MLHDGLKARSGVSAQSYMENNSKSPTVVIAVGMVILLMGGFLFFVSVGTNGRKTGSFASRINFQSFSARAADYYGGLKRGGASIKSKADNFMSSFWDEPGSTASAARYAEAAKRGGGDEEWNSSANGEDGDSFGKYYSKNYGGGSGMDPNSWVDNSEGGASFSGGASGGGSSSQSGASSRGTPRPKQQRTAAAAPAFAAAAGRPGSGLRPGFGGPSAGSPAAAQRQYASLPARNGAQNAALQYGRGTPAAGDKSNNKFSGMSGNQTRGAADLNGADENMSGGAQSSYNSNMSGGAAAVGGGSSGGSIPAASAAAKVSGVGSSAGSSSAGASLSPAGAPNMGFSALYDAPEDTDLLRSVVSESQNGRESSYLSPEDAKAAPDETMLKSGAIAGADGKGVAPTPDPKTLEELSPERKLELKTNIHVFLKRIQNRFGAIAEIKTTSCASTLDLCKEHGVTGNYLTMRTQKGARLDLGVKYIKTQWRRYTIDFQKPGTDTQKPK